MQVFPTNPSKWQLTHQAGNDRLAGALFWGLVVGSASFIGAGVGYFANLSHRVIGTVMGFGSGVLISALAYDLIEESYRQGGSYPSL